MGEISFCSSTKSVEELKSKSFGRKAVSFILLTVTGGVALSALNDLAIFHGCSRALEHEFVYGGPPLMRETLTKAGKLGLLVLEDLTALPAGRSAIWLHVSSIQWTFALDILEFILSNYVVVFKTLVSYEQVMRHQICSLLMTSLRTNSELEGEAGEPIFRRLVPYNQVFLSMLVKVTSLDLPLWHHILVILVLEILRGFCVDARTLGILFKNFDM